MTKPDWRALDHRIAREVMGWSGWNELPREARQAYWVLMDEEPADWTLAYNRGKWWFLDESGRADWEDSIEEWRPHNNVAQALAAKDKIVAQEWCFDLSNRPGTPSVVYFWQMLRPSIGIQGKADTDAKAICLAIDHWRDAQKETQNDTG